MFKAFPPTFTWHDIFIQSLGFIAFALFMAGYQIKDTRRTQRFFAPANFFYGMQYFLLGSPSSSLIMFAATLRDLAGGYGSDKVLRITSAFFLVFIWVVTIMLSKNPHEYLMTLSGTISTVAVLSRENFYKFRFLLMMRQTVMIFFNIWIQSYGGIIHLFIALASNIFGTYRHSRKPKKSDSNYVDE